MLLFNFFFLVKYCVWYLCDNNKKRIHSNHKRKLIQVYYTFYLLLI